MKVTLLNILLPFFPNLKDCEITFMVAGPNTRRRQNLILRIVFCYFSPDNCFGGTYQLAILHGKHRLQWMIINEINPVTFVCLRRPSQLFQFSLFCEFVSGRECKTGISNCIGIFFTIRLFESCFAQHH